VTACRISLGGEGNALYPVLPSLLFIFKLWYHWYDGVMVVFLRPFLALAPKDLALVAKESLETQSIGT